MFILCCSIAFNLHKFEKRRQNYTYFYKPPNFFVSFLHFHSIFTFFLFVISRIHCNFALESIKNGEKVRFRALFTVARTTDFLSESARNLICEVITTVSNRKCGEIVHIMSNHVCPHFLFQEIELSLDFLKDNSLICEISA